MPYKNPLDKHDFNVRYYRKHAIKLRRNRRRRYAAQKAATQSFPPRQ